jgi:4-amino-4-deoxy-L-arabinose transferase-like glycosyltransferase
MQIVLAAIGAWWVVTAAARLRGTQAGTIAGCFYTFHPSLIWSSVALMSESICVPLVPILLCFLTRHAQPPWRRLIILAVLLAILCLARSTFAYFVPIVAGLLVFEARKRATWPARLAPAVGLLLAFALLVSPWTIRNYLHWKRFIPFSTKAGVNAWMHNHPGLKVEFGPGVESGTQPIDVFDPRIQSLADEATREDKLMDMFRDFVITHPTKFAGLVFMRFLMALLPVAVVSRSTASLVVAWYAKGVVLLVLILAVYQGHRTLLWRSAPWLLFVGYWTLMQSLGGAGLRYRLPADAAWACIVGVMCSAILSNFTQRRETRLQLPRTDARH